MADDLVPGVGLDGPRFEGSAGLEDRLAAGMEMAARRRVHRLAFPLDRRPNFPEADMPDYR